MSKTSNLKESLDKVDIPKALAHQPEPSYDLLMAPQAVLYALGIGYSKDPMNKEELKYTYELDKKFTVFPTYACVLAKSVSLIDEIMQVPGLPKFNPMNIVHGEQSLEIFEPLKVDSKYKTVQRIVDVQDKGKITFVFTEYAHYQINMTTKEERLSCRQIVNLAIRNLGGFGFKSLKNIAINIPKQPKDRKPDFTYEEKTTPEQAILYRLNGDYNPLHIDPSQAKVAGFNKPILHGLCFYAIALKGVINTVCNGDSSLVKKYDARFTASVFPGETLQFDIWMMNDTQIVVYGQTKEREQKTVIKALITLKQKPKM